MHSILGELHNEAFLFGAGFAEMTFTEENEIVL